MAMYFAIRVLMALAVIAFAAIRAFVVYEPPKREDTEMQRFLDRWRRRR
jgi:hypothetical protein